MVPVDKYCIPDSSENRDGPKNTRTTSMIGTAASALLHLLVLGLLFAVTSDPLGQDHVGALPVIQVTLAPPLLTQGKGTNPASVIPSQTRRKHTGPLKEPNEKIPSREEVREPITNRFESTENHTERDSTVILASPSVIGDLSRSQEESAVDSVPALPGKETATSGDRKSSSETGGTSESLMPRYRKTPYPPYPHAARMKGQEGLVVLSVRVLGNGRVGQVKIKNTSGYAILDYSAMTAVQSWQFEPARRGDIPQASTVDIPVRFSLKEGRP